MEAPVVESLTNKQFLRVPGYVLLGRQAEARPDRALALMELRVLDRFGGRKVDRWWLGGFRRSKEEEGEAREEDERQQDD